MKHNSSGNRHAGDYEIEIETRAGRIAPAFVVQDLKANGCLHTNSFAGRKVRL